MEFSMILEALASQGIWCLLFVWLFWDSRKQAQVREDRLTQIIEAHSEQLKEITNTLETINGKIDRFHGVESQEA